MKEKITLVTGASRGIGRATALLLARHGHKVCINYRNKETQAAEVVSEIRSAGGTAIAISADLADEHQIIGMFNRLDDEFGPLTGLVNNAGILLPQSSIEDIRADRLQQIFSVNVSGSFICAREAVKRMSARHGGNGGSIVNVSSAASRLGSPGEYIDYAASKGAIDSLTRGLSLEVAAYGVRVNAVRPGFIYTEIHADGGEAGRVDRVSAALPMKRGGHPEEVAEAIHWLLSDAESYVTVNFIYLAGGK